MQMRTWFAVLILLLLLNPAFSQKKDSTRSSSHFSGSISVTHNGISLIPTFSLGKPAAIMLLSTGKGRLTFEPDIRLALEGKPWSFLFWWRYKLMNTKKFRVTIGAHPAINFRTFRLPVNGDSADVLVARRFIAAELSPNFQVSKKASIGMYYLVSRGFDKNTPRITHFITVNSVISNISLPGKWYMRFNPQIFYLKQDKRDGFYATATLALARKNFPFSVSAIINKTIESNVTGSKDIVWNTSLVYSFSKKYVRQ
jgi:hypothetical protein